MESFQMNCDFNLSLFSSSPFAIYVLYFQISFFFLPKPYTRTGGLVRTLLLVCFIFCDVGITQYFCR